ncbi:acylneuraminate cytidylyltransferase family protein [Prevotella nigrescens]|uniref:acylneuraminate cytidylyltransferase family protein n=1 Tax=Prevotella nigrescens TaxID=28133 RepID=UPI0002183183|nr:acylneuraminate cytidylyltransferase family protein [Prevotella nigrescens]EGQ17106.1 N-acylneuraminate cytidylyltransferase [Prevotella nigrescens ATCC 33563]UAK27660.1 acylneuraminate cytidylyltransferase family protein [Prevotella nigrescens]WMS21602.1 acylneuraminate cytidylyltransferase family protein [Prevotella nigrescens]SUB92237.1 N-acylneuraminate cytidylyltransferase [Prevotella nigrescens]
MKRIAIIPARSGSKGLKDKNIIELCGKPLISYSIEAALNTNLFNKVIVSTDSELYAQISRQCGADILMRGENLSDDKATTYMVLEDIIKHRVIETYDYFVLLQPTSPLRNAKHITEAIEKFDLKYNQFDFLVSMKEAEHAKVLVNRIEKDESLKFFDTDFSNYRRQGYKDYSPNGAIFIAKPACYLVRKHFFGAKSLAYIMTKEDSIDIDGPLDLILAKAIMTQR